MTDEYLSLPVDGTSAARLADQDLRLEILDTTDLPALEAWLEAEARGFYESRPTRESLDIRLAEVNWRRYTGVWDRTAQDAGFPVATVASWPTPLTVPGGQMRAVLGHQRSHGRAHSSAERNCSGDARGGAADG